MSEILGIQNGDLASFKFHKCDDISEEFSHTDMSNICFVFLKDIKELRFKETTLPYFVKIKATHIEAKPGQVGSNLTAYSGLA